MCCYFWFDFCRFDLLRGLLCHKLRRCRVDVHESKQRTLTFLTHTTLLCTRALTAASKVDSNFLAAKLLGETWAVAARAWVARSCDVQARDATRAGFGRVPYLTLDAHERRRTPQHTPALEPCCGSRADSESPIRVRALEG